MIKKIIKFDDTKIEEYEFHQYKNPISINEININEIVASNNFPFGKQDFKYFISYKDGSVSDRKSLDELEKKLLDSLNIIDSSHFTGSQKLWFLQHLLIPRIQWPILIYEVPISLVSKLEQAASVYIRKWIKLHKSITSLSFYSSASPCPLPVRSLRSVPNPPKLAVTYC